MKNMFKALLFAMAFGSGVSAFAANNPVISSTDYRRNAEYIRVYNEDAVAHEAGDVLIYVVPASATYDGLSVSTTSTAAVPRVAGVVPVGETLRASSWGRLQVYGYHPAITIAVANSAGDALVTSTTAEAAGVYTLATSTSTVGADFGVFGVALEATTSSTTVAGLIKIK